MLDETNRPVMLTWLTRSPAKITQVTNLHIVEPVNRVGRSLEIAASLRIVTASRGRMLRLYVEHIGTVSLLIATINFQGRSMSIMGKVLVIGHLWPFIHFDALAPLHVRQILWSVWGNKAPLALIRMIVTVCVERRAPEAQLTALAVVVWTIQAIVLTISLHDRANSKELSLAVLRWKHVPTIRVNHAITWTCPWMNIASELIRLVEGAIYQVCSIVICVLIEGIQERPTWLGQELSLVLLAIRWVLLVWKVSSPSITISLWELFIRFWIIAIIRVTIVFSAKLLKEPFSQANKEKNDEEDKKGPDEPDRLAILNLFQFVRFRGADEIIRVTVARHTLIRVCASVTNTFITLANDLICTVALWATRGRIVRAVGVLLACLVAIKEMAAHHIDAATRHTFKAESTDVLMLLATV